MRNELEKLLRATCQDLFNLEVKPELTRTEERYGDFATNIALQLASKLSKSPREIAEQIVKRIQENRVETISEITLAGPGFINFKLSDQFLLSSLDVEPAKNLIDQRIVAEYSDPSSFKVLHAGHLYTSVVGDAIANLLEIAGGTVHRVNFGGDVGMHVAKTMWAILGELDGEYPEKLAAVPNDQRADWMSERYVEGNAAYEDDEVARAEIVELNKRVYQLHGQGDHDSNFAQIYWTCRQWSYDYFDAFYARIGSHFDKYYPESLTMPIGLKTVREQLEKGVYEESNGAIVFRGEKYGLHTRVFINSQGLPTYEAKDVGLIIKKWEDYHPDKSVILTDNAQAEYMSVVLKSVEQFAPEFVRNTVHLTHGRVKLAGGVKMSSREGNIVRAVDVLDVASQANRAETGRDDEQTVLGAVKYSFLRSRLGGDIVYDPKESVSLEGNSGPYLQYAHARARSILRKTSNVGSLDIEELTDNERTLVRKIGEYPEAVDKALNELMPHHVCTYLYELAQSFNRFYEHNRVIGDEREKLRLALVGKYANRLKSGLELLGIYAPNKM